VSALAEAANPVVKTRPKSTIPSSLEPPIRKISILFFTSSSFHVKVSLEERTQEQAHSPTGTGGAEPRKPLATTLGKNRKPQSVEGLPAIELPDPYIFRSLGGCRVSMKTKRVSGLVGSGVAALQLPRCAIYFH